MTGFDIAVLILVGMGAITGFLRGFVQEVLALAAWVLSLVAIHNLHTPMTQFLEKSIGNQASASVLAFAILLLVPYAIVKLLADRLGEVSRSSLIGPIDRVIGFGFGAIKGAIIVVMAFSVLVLGYDTIWGTKGRPLWITQARSYPFVNRGSEMLVKLIAERRRSVDSERTQEEAEAAK